VFRGCILGGAIGDALGAPVERLMAVEIRQRFGQVAVDDFEPWDGHPKGAWTDDTQLTRATAVGELRALACEQTKRVCDPTESVWERYLEWRTTQEFEAERRGPGRTCLEALTSPVMGTVDDPLNDSKGSGGIMRVAPAGLAYLPERAFDRAVEFAAVTHGHPTGYLAAGFFADVVARVVRGVPLLPAVSETRELLLGWDGMDETLEAVDLSVELFIADECIDEGIDRLGQGWTAEEALGITLFCALNFPEDFAAGTLAAVNHDGDSDTTGSLAGALLGASLGVESIPGSWVTQVEDAGGLAQLADDLYAGFILGEAVDTTRYPPD
jgi:ADP-ribosylglycohydrolase